VVVVAVLMKLVVAVLVGLEQAHQLYLHLLLILLLLELVVLPLLLVE
tara:strand:+ start:45 stop:185 length:141 start_codon:yes stop_codon:yes gene_type:complete